mgnify:CR=1 FL=1
MIDSERSLFVRQLRELYHLERELAAYLVEGDAVSAPDPEEARLADVEGLVELVALDGPAQVLERVEVPGGRVALLGAGDVEADDSGVAVGDHPLGDLRAPGGGARRNTGFHP